MTVQLVDDEYKVIGTVPKESIFKIYRTDDILRNGSELAVVIDYNEKTWLICRDCVYFRFGGDYSAIIRKDHVSVNASKIILSGIVTNESILAK